MYRVVTPFASPNRRFPAGSELSADDLPEHLTVEQLLASAHLELIGSPGPADPPAYEPPPPVEADHDEPAA